MQLGEKPYRILKAIPGDHWITGKELSEKVGLDTKIISAIIRSQLLYKYVSRRDLPKSSEYGGFSYKRRIMISRV